VKKLSYTLKAVLKDRSSTTIIMNAAPAREPLLKLRRYELDY